MGAGRTASGRRFTSLTVELLEDRFLLSSMSLSGPASMSAILPAYAAGSPAAIQSSPTPHDHSATPHATTDLSASPSVVPAQPGERGPSSPDGASHFSSEARSTSAPTPTPPITTTATSNPVLSSLVLSQMVTHPAAGDSDRDDGLPESAEEAAHLLLNQVTLDHFLASAAASQADAAVEVLPTPLAIGTLSLNGNLLPGAGLGTAGFAGTPLMPPAFPSPVPMEPGQTQEQPEGDQEEHNIPLVPELTPLAVPPQEAADVPPPEPSTDVPFAKLLPIDLKALQQSADALFEQLARLSEEWTDTHILRKCLPWLVAGGAAAYGGVRLRRRRSSSVMGGEDDGGLEPGGFTVRGVE